MTWLQTRQLFTRQIWEPEKESETSELATGLMEAMSQTDAALEDLKADAAEIGEKYEEPQKDSILEDYLATCESAGVKPADRLVKSYQELDRLIEKEVLLNKETEAVIGRARKLIGKSRTTSLNFVEIVEMSVYGNFDKDAIFNFIFRDYGWDEVRLTNGWKNIKITQGDVSVRFF